MIKEKIITSHEAQAEALSLSKLKVSEILRKTSGSFISKRLTVDLPMTHLVKNVGNVSSLQHCNLDPGSVFLCIPFNSTILNLNGSQYTQENPAILASSEDAFVGFSENHNAYGLCMPASHLKSYLDEEIFEKIADNNNTINFNTINIERKQRIASVMHSIRTGLSCNSLLSKQALRDIDDSLVISFANLLGGLSKTSKAPSLKSRYIIVRRAVEYINNIKFYNPSVAEVAKRSFCSVRTLDYAFKDILNVSPKRYLILKRLHNIRAELSCGTVSKVTVLLHKYGVVNCGRFSRDYKLLFGEGPKKTITRVQ